MKDKEIRLLLFRLGYVVTSGPCSSTSVFRSFARGLLGI